MTDEEKIAELSTWRGVYRSISQEFERIEGVFGLVVDWPLWEAVWAGFEAYTETVGRLVGDKDDWLNWFCYENDMGAKGYDAGHDNKVRPIKTIEDLLSLINQNQL